MSDITITTYEKGVNNLKHLGGKDISSNLEWILDQYNEKKPKAPTVAEFFNTYKSQTTKTRSSTCF